MRSMRLPAAGMAALALTAGALMTACGGASPDGFDTGMAAGSKAVRMGGVADTFGLAEDTNFFTIDTGAGLVLKIRRTDNGVSTQSAGDIASMVYNGVQYQDQSRGSQVNSGFDFLYTGVSAVNVAATAVGSDVIKVTVTAGNLTHYYIVKRGVNNVYMGTYFTAEPNTLGLARYILRVPINALPNGPAPSDLRGTTTTVESGDVFGLPNGETRSKHYSNMRLKDWQYIGATNNAAGVGMWVVRDNNEGNSGGPFYRSLLNQGTGTSQEITYIVNYGEAQTETLRTNILNQYTLVFNHGGVPDAGDTSFLGSLGLAGYVGPAGRGRVAGVGLAGMDPAYEYTVAFANSTAQYWAKADAGTGHFDSSGMLPGTYTLKVYKNEYAVATQTVTVTAGGTVALNTIDVAAGDPSKAVAQWRIGDWDGTPAEFINGAKLTTMHPSDVRMASWTPGDYTVGTSAAASGFPAYQWKDVNGTLTIRFKLTKAQIADYQLRLGITAAYAGGRPKPQINGWIPANPAASAQPSTRTLTVGTYRGNNTLYTFNVPASELVVGENVLTLTAISGSSGVKYLSPGYAWDAVDFIKQP